ncbi:MAG TPA: hypothetical protein PLT66_06585 [Bacillota bacterium]|nr:hypothetical protein [Bacillota bacterium]
MPDASSFSKKIFALLLEKGKGERSWRQYSIDAGISYVQMRKLAQCEQVNPPRPKLIRKIASCSENGITIDDFMFSVGIIPSRQQRPAPQNAVAAASRQAEFLENYRSLGAKQRRIVEEFTEFLTTKVADT